MPRTRSKLGKFLDDWGISQEWLIKQSGLGRTTISRLCTDKDYDPTLSTVRKLMRALRKVDRSVKIDDFFNI
ncbi:MAG: helix-turn-helix domain-containing protein [Acidobacterium ailaaui]|nr:helix-turn-helix domain-containing protein [Pseudacidobacterium ailaaui]